MEELKVSIEDFKLGENNLREAAKKWAATAIQTYDDKLLRKALEISASIANFLNELERD